MIQNFLCLTLFIIFNGIVINSLPLQHCSEHEIEKLKTKYKKKIWSEAEDLEDIFEIEEEGNQEINVVFKHLNKEVNKLIKFAEENGFDIYKCLNFSSINNLQGAVEENYNNIIQETKEKLLLYVKEALDLIDACPVLNISCKKIEKCYKEKVDHFDDDIIEEGVENLEDASKKYIKIIKKDINKLIDKLKEQTHSCYLEHLQTTTSTSNPGQSTTEQATEIPTQHPPESTTAIITKPPIETTVETSSESITQTPPESTPVITTKPPQEPSTELITQHPSEQTTVITTGPSREPPITSTSELVTQDPPEPITE